MSKPVCAVVGVGPLNGASFARKFDAEGYAVALLSRSTGFIGQLAKELQSANAYACDVTDEAAIDAAFAAVRSDLGEIDVLIYNAGSGTWGDIEKLHPDAFEAAWRVNAMGLFLVAQRVIPSMKERGAGAIIVVGATASLRGKPFTTAFAPAKAAQRSLAQAIARHLGPAGIHVALMIIDGQIGRPGGDEPAAPADKLDPDAIADGAYYLARQHRSAWTFELDMRPHVESW